MEVMALDSEADSLVRVETTSCPPRAPADSFEAWWIAGRYAFEINWLSFETLVIGKTPQ
jgi:hypothetical protein